MTADYVSHSYTDNNEPATITYPGGREIRYERDRSGRVSGVISTFEGETTVVADAITSKPFEQVAGMTLGNGLGILRAHDRGYRLTGISGEQVLCGRTIGAWVTGDVPVPPCFS